MWWSHDNSMWARALAGRLADIALAEAGQTLWNRHVAIKNLRGNPERPQRDARRLPIGRTDAGRILTLVIEETIDPTTWLLITSRDSTRASLHPFPVSLPRRPFRCAQ